MPGLKFYLFGLPRIEQEGHPVKIERRKSLALAAYLALNRETQSRDTLAALLWPEHDQNAARSSLSNSLWHLKKLFGRDWLIMERERININPEEEPWVDVNEFRSLLAQSKAHDHPEKQVCEQCVESLTLAVNLYRGDFMAGFNLPDNEVYEDWKASQNDTWCREFTGILEKLIRYHDNKAEFDPAIHFAERWLQVDPLNENVHWHLMRLHARCGQPAAALRQYEECARLLSEELHTRPQEKLKKLYEEINEQRIPAVLGSPSNQNRFKKDLKLFLQPGFCMGRENELKEIGRLLDDPNCRLLTLVGPGGIGKTTLALQAIFSNKERMCKTEHFFIPLTHLKSAEWIVPAIADAVGLSFYQDSNPRKQLIDFLHDKNLLLILDNFEHLLSGAELLAEIIDKAPEIKFLITSQQSLNLRSEWILEVRGLTFPPDEYAADSETYNAVRFFLQNVYRVNPAFFLTEEEKPYITRICRFLGGMPLGIELAAAWARMLSCKEISRELEHDPGSLFVEFGDIPDRQQSLRSVFEYSWKLFSEEEKQILKKLSVFRGGFSMEAALRLAGNPMAVMLSIMNKSFLNRNIAGRYEILEILRSFINEKALENAEEMEAVQRWHSAYYGRLFSEQMKFVEGEHKEKILTAIGTELDNLREGWQWAVARCEYRMIDYYLGNLFNFYREKGWFLYGEEILSEAIKTLKQSRERSPEAEAVIGKMLSLRGWFCHYLARPDQAQNSIREGMTILRRLDQKEDLAKSCYRLGYDLFFVGQLEEAENLLQEGILLFKAIGDRMGMTDCRRLIGIIKSVQGKYQEAQKAFDESLVVYQELGNITGICYVNDCLGIMLEAQGKYSEAVRIHERSIAYYRKTGEGWGMANSLNNLGFACFGNGEFERSEQCFKDAIRMTIHNQVVPILQEALMGMAFCLARKGRKEIALELVAYVMQDATVHIDIHKRAEKLLEELRVQFDEENFDSIILRSKSKDFQYYLDILHKEKYL